MDRCSRKLLDYHGYCTYSIIECSFSLMKIIGQMKFESRIMFYNDSINDVFDLEISFFINKGKGQIRLSIIYLIPHSFITNLSDLHFFLHQGLYANPPAYV